VSFGLLPQNSVWANCERPFYAGDQLSPWKGVLPPHGAGNFILRQVKSSVPFFSLDLAADFLGLAQREFPPFPRGPPNPSLLLMVTHRLTPFPFLELGSLILTVCAVVDIPLPPRLPPGDLRVLTHIFSPEAE